MFVLLTVRPFVLFLCLLVRIESNPGIKVLISEGGLKYAAGQIADVLSEEILRMRIGDIRGSEPFTYGILNYTLSDIEINGFTRPDVGIQINPSGGVTLTFTEASVAATATVVCKKAGGAFKFRHTTSVILSVYGLSVFVNANVALDDSSLPFVEATACSSSMGSIMASFQGDVDSLYNPIARSKRFRRSLHSSLGGAICTLVTKHMNSNEALSTFRAQEAVHDSATLDLELISDLVFGQDYVESCHRGRMVKDQSFEEPPVMYLVPERMLTFGVSEATLNSLSRVLHNGGLLTVTIPEEEFKESMPKLKSTYPASGEAATELIVSTSSAPAFVVNPKGVFLKLEIEGRLVETNKTSSLLAHVRLNAHAQLKPSLSYRNLTASLAAFVPSVKDASPGTGSELAKELAGRIGEEVRRHGNRLLGNGLPMPTLTGSLFINDHHKPYNRYLSVTCDVIYAP